MIIVPNPSNPEGYTITFEELSNELILKAKIDEKKTFDKLMNDSLKFKLNSKELHEKLVLLVNNPNINPDAIAQNAVGNVLKSHFEDTTQFAEKLALMTFLMQTGQSIVPANFFQTMQSVNIDFSYLLDIIYVGFTNHTIDTQGNFGHGTTRNLDIIRMNRDGSLATVGQKTITIDIDDITRQSGYITTPFPMEQSFLDGEFWVAPSYQINAAPPIQVDFITFSITALEAPLLLPNIEFLDEIYPQLVIVY